MSDGTVAAVEIVESADAVKISDRGFDGLEKFLGLGEGDRWNFLTLLADFKNVGVI